MPTFLAVLALFQTPATPSGQAPADSYANPATRELVSQARAARERNERLVTSYTATVTQRIGAGIRALSRDRMLYRQELAAKISWHRDGKSTIEVTGAREGLPIAKRKEQVPRHLEGSVKWLVVNPAEDYLGMIGGDGDDDDGFVYPLREGGEDDYRFAIGDTTTITLASGKKIRVELKITRAAGVAAHVRGALVRRRDPRPGPGSVPPGSPYELRRDFRPET